MTLNKDKKVCWVIGSSHGIGEAIARKAYLDGYNLVISARSVEKLEELKNQLLLKPNNNSEIGKILVSKTDVSDVDSLQKSLTLILEDFQKIDLVIFCPALYQPMSAINFDLEFAKKIVDVNLGGCLNFLHVIIPQMAKQKFGQIGVIASVAGYFGLPQSLAYGASKAALINLCEGIYPELQRLGIDISVINPGFVKTRLTDKNKFKMPFLISTEKAAENVMNGLKEKKFEIHFPKKFTIFLKILQLLPYKIFFFITKKIS
jgi:short-subunit dehydrogenase